MTKIIAHDPLHDPLRDPLPEPHDSPRERRAKREAPKRAAAGGTTTAPGRGRGLSAPAKVAAKARPAAPPAAGSRPDRDAESTERLERGARVNVTSGPFAGKSGVVQELVGRRSARVLLGLLPVQLDLDDLTPSATGPGGRGRPRLSSSHRKPVPARS